MGLRAVSLFLTIWRTHYQVLNSHLRKRLELMVVPQELQTTAVDRTQGLFQSTLDQLSEILNLQPGQVQNFDLDLLSNLLDNLQPDLAPDLALDPLSNTVPNDPDQDVQPPVAIPGGVNNEEETFWLSPTSGHLPELINKIMASFPRHRTTNLFSWQYTVVSRCKWALNYCSRI